MLRKQKLGDITIDNEQFRHHHGEISIVKDVLPTDKRITIVAQIDSDFTECLLFISGGQKVKIQLRKNDM